MSPEILGNKKIDQGYIIELFSNMDVDPNETIVYLFLTRRGPHTAKQLMSSLKIEKSKIYRYLKNLQSKALVQMTLDFPSKFTALPFEKVSEQWVYTKKKEIEQIRKMSSEIKLALKNLDVNDTVETLNRFAMIEGINSILSKGASMANEAKSEIIIMDDNAKAKAYNYFSSLEEMIRNKNKNVKGRYITRVSEENKDQVKYIYNKLFKGRVNSQARHTDLPSKFFQRFILVDEKQVLYSTVTWEEICSHYGNPIEKAMWTNNEALIRTFKKLFEDTWSKSVDLEEKLSEIKTV